MQDTPAPEQLIQAVATFLRSEAGPALARAGEPALAYQARVAANMLGIAVRQAELAPTAEADELTRLRTLLQASDADLATLNRRLADALADGTLGLATPGLADHLWRTTLTKLAVDQPRYAGYLRAMALR